MKHAYIVKFEIYEEDELWIDDGDEGILELGFKKNDNWKIYDIPMQRYSKFNDLIIRYNCTYEEISDEELFLLML